MLSSSKKFLGFLIIFIAATALFWVVSDNFSDDATAPPYETALVDVGDVYQRVSLVGHVNAEKTVEVGAEVSGRVDKVLVEENQKVSEGQVLAIIAPEAFSNRVSRAKAKLQQASATLSKQTAAVDRLRLKLRRRSNVDNQLAFSAEDLELLKYELTAAQSDLEFSQAEVQLAKSDLVQAELELSRTAIKSPVDGVVLQNHIQSGQTVNAALETPVLFVVASNLSEIQLEANIDEAIVTKIKPGHRVSFTADAYQDVPFSATLRRIRKVPAAGLNYVAYPAVFTATTSKETPLVPGMTVNLTVDLIEPARNVVRIPIDATRYFHPEFTPPIPDKIKENVPRPHWEAAAFGYDQGKLLKENKSRVFVLTEENEVVPRLFTIGVSNFSYVEAIDGEVEVGDRVILGRKSYGQQ